MAIRIPNRQARRLWLNLQGLAKPPVGNSDILGIIRQLGFVQLDSIRNVTRAHHHILWSRNQAYREPMLGRLLAEDRSIFEHFTHDASVLPMEFYPVWTRRFARMEAHFNRSEAYRTARSNGDHDAIKQRIEAEGPLSTHAFDSKLSGKKEMWARPPHKQALDHMWYNGELATSHRANFVKYYDLKERVIPAPLRRAELSDGRKIDWLCRGALDRLGFASLGEMRRFWDAVSTAEVKAWMASATDELQEVQVETAAGDWLTCFAPAHLDHMLGDALAPTSRLRIINPFDPVVRDRRRLQQLFGFDYRIEIFVPPAKRQWGYYVYPLLEGDRFVGRIELKSDRKAGIIEVRQLWAEPAVKWTGARGAKLDAELHRLARLVGADTVSWACSRHPSVPG